MAVYGASKHAIEGYSESLDHEVREYGVRALLVEPAYTRTGFEAKRAARYAAAGVRGAAADFDRVMAAAIKDGDDPAVVAKVIVAAATDPKPKLRYTAGTLAGRVSHRDASSPPGPSTVRSAAQPAGRLTSHPAHRPARRGAFSSDLTRSITMGISTEAQQFAQFLESVRTKARQPASIWPSSATSSTHMLGIDRTGRRHLRRRGRGRRPRPVGHP